MANNQLKCSIIYSKIAIRASDDGRRINYEWPALTETAFKIQLQCILSTYYKYYEYKVSIRI